MLRSLLLAASLLASPLAAAGAPAGTAPAGAGKPAAAAPAASPSVPAPRGPLLIETKRGKLEFDHQQHAKTACADCHKGQAVPARIGIKGKDAPHKFCQGCHKALQKGPQKCTACHQK